MKTKKSLACTALISSPLSLALAIGAFPKVILVLAAVLIPLTFTSNLLIGMVLLLFLAPSELRVGLL